MLRTDYSDRLLGPALGLLDHWRRRRVGRHCIPGGGAVLTFDDRSIAEWYDTDETLRAYQWKATFCVSHLQDLGASELAQLRALEARGHEIACHGAQHLDAVKTVAASSVRHYIAREVLPVLAAARAHGISITSFAYPYGARDRRIDVRLLKHFAVLRGTVYGEKAVREQRCLADGTRVVFGLGIDCNYGNDIERLLQVLEAARAAGRIAVFYGHRTVPNASQEWTTSYAVLKAICGYVRDSGMSFLTLSELRAGHERLNEQRS